jgi:hypothetical protein
LFYLGDAGPNKMQRQVIKISLIFIGLFLDAVVLVSVGDICSVASRSDDSDQYLDLITRAGV